MTLDKLRLGRTLQAVGLALLLAACRGGGSGVGTDTGTGTGGNAPVAGDCAGTGSVTISGVAEYEFVPAVAVAGGGARLDYDAAEFRPIRGAEVQAICPGDASAYATTVTDAAGEFTLAVPESVNVIIRVRALIPGESGNVSVVDNTRSQAVWSAEGESFDSGTGSVEVELRAASGWDGSSYSSTRAAAPFAILDSVYTAMQKVLQVDADANFPALKLNWSPDNTATCSSDLKEYPFPDGCIGTSFFVNVGGEAGRNIFILGDADDDTDEYDNHVIIHEWGHYYENAFARSDSIGGAHGNGDVLDLRVAFGEGWGNAFAGIATDDPVYVDTMDTNQAHGFTINVEEGFEGADGWWNEASIQEIIFDLYDGANDDAAALTFAPIHDVMTGLHRTTASVTSIFSFIHFLKQHPAASNVRDVVAVHDIAPITNEWGDGRAAGGLLNGDGDDGSEFGSGYEEYVVPVHENIGTITNGLTVTEICTTSDLASSQSEYNRLGVRRFLRFDVAMTADWSITLDGPAGSDPDFYVMLNGDIVVAGEDLGETEVESASLPSGRTYVIEVLDYENANDDGTNGRSCLDITFEHN